MIDASRILLCVSTNGNATVERLDDGLRVTVEDPAKAAFRVPTKTAASVVRCSVDNSGSIVCCAAESRLSCQRIGDGGELWSLAIPNDEWVHSPVITGLSLTANANYLLVFFDGSELLAGRLFILSTRDGRIEFESEPSICSSGFAVSRNSKAAVTLRPLFWFCTRTAATIDVFGGRDLQVRDPPWQARHGQGSPLRLHRVFQLCVLLSQFLPRLVEVDDGPRLERKTDRATNDPIGFRVVATVRSGRYAASSLFRCLRADASGTPPINIASCVASIVTCG